MNHGPVIDLDRQHIVMAGGVVDPHGGRTQADRLETDGFSVVIYLNDFFAAIGYFITPVAAFDQQRPGRFAERGER